MDVESTIQFILDSQAKTEAQGKETDLRIREIAGFLDNAERQRDGMLDHKLAMLRHDQICREARNRRASSRG